MKVLLIFAHPEPHSFSAALKDTAVETLTAAGHQVVVSDLYGMGWQAVLSREDFPELEALTFDPSRAQEAAWRNESQAPDVVEEQAKVAEADLLLFHFPLWWFSMPAVLKGWVDRVLSRGFAYSAGRKYGRGHFLGKRAMVCITTGTAASLYQPNGIDGDLLHVLWPIHNGTLAYTGLTVLPPFAAWMPGRVTDDQRAAYRNGYAERLRTLDSTEPLFFHPWEDYDEHEQLKPGIRARSGVQWNPRSGSDINEASLTAENVRAAFRQ